ncbi:MAG: hypothetical protein GY822_16925 [Deltaproteobacteria bacterium]|nr:hypothetical protein [Deltaproteobacteria bacterium]
MAHTNLPFFKRTLILSLATFTLNIGLAGCPTSPGPASPEPEDTGPVCGNGQLDLGEVCDGNNLDGESCSSLGMNDGDLSCRDDCSGFIRSECGEAASCGDGVRESSETCDTNDLDGATCDSLGFQGGLVTCGAKCLYDTSACGAPQLRRWHRARRRSQRQRSPRRHYL